MIIATVLPLVPLEGRLAMLVALSVSAGVTHWVFVFELSKFLTQSTPRLSATRRALSNYHGIHLMISHVRRFIICCSGARLSCNTTQVLLHLRTDPHPPCCFIIPRRMIDEALCCKLIRRLPVLNDHCSRPLWDGCPLPVIADKTGQL